MLLFSLIRVADASHLLGGSIEYKHLGGTKYLLTAKLYRDCRGISLAAPTFGVYAGNSGGNGCGTYSLTGFKRVSITDITNRCDSAVKGPCDPLDSNGTGQGMELHVYQMTVDLTQSPISNFYGKTSCCEITFYSSFSYRAAPDYSSCKSLGSPCDFNVKAMLQQCNLKKCADTANNSPVYKNDPIQFPGCNVMLVHSNGVVDSDPADLLKFSLQPAINSLPNNAISYSSPFSYRYFVTPYCVPSGSVSCTPNISTLPAKGIYFDTATGDVIFTPTKCDELAVYVVKADEFRKDTSGNWIPIGYMMRDISFYIWDGGDHNNAPTLSGPLQNKVCAGDKICFDIEGKDATFTPYQTIPDTVQMYWDTAIPAATFKIKNPTDREKTAEFCWQTHDSDARIPAHRFSVTVTDNHCTNNLKTSRTFLIHVYNKAKAELKIKELNCNVLALEAAPDKLFMGIPFPDWKISDAKGKVYFTSKKLKDTTRYLTGNKYYISLRINNPGGCYTDYLDSITLKPQTGFTLGPDTFGCYDQTFTVLPKTSKFSHSPFVISWTVKNSTIQNDTLPFLTFKNFRNDTLVYAKLTDSLGCVFRDTVRVLVKPTPKVYLGADKRICADQFAVLDAKNADTLWYLWNTGETTRTIIANKAQNYWVKITDTVWHCSTYDTVKIMANHAVIANAGRDTAICTNSQMQLNGSYENDSFGALTYWYDASTGAFINSGNSIPISPKNYNGNGAAAKIFPYEFRVSITENGLTCTNSDTINILVNTLPKVAWFRNPLDSRCHDYGDIYLDTFIVLPDYSLRKKGNIMVWGTKTGHGFKSGMNTNGLVDSLGYRKHIFRASKINNATELSGGKYLEDILYVWFKDTNGCINTANTKQRINGVPVIVLDTSFYCQDKGYAKLDSSVLRPKTKFGTRQIWRTLKVPAGVDSSYVVVDNSGGSGTDWELRFGATSQNYFAGNYQLEFTVKDQVTGCFAQDTTLVIVVAEPVLTSANPAAFCSADGPHELGKLYLSDSNKPDAAASKFQIYAYNGNTNPTSFGNTKIVNGHYLSANAATGTWSIFCTDGTNGCPSEGYFNMQIIESPVAAFTTSPVDSAPLNNPVFTINNTSNIGSGNIQYFWNFGTGKTADTSNQKNPTITYPAISANYKIMLIVTSDSGCRDTAFQNVQVGSGNLGSHIFNKKQVWLDDQMRINNAIGQVMETRIYDMSGRIVSVFARNVGAELSNGIYLYEILVQMDSHETAKISGLKQIAK